MNVLVIVHLVKMVNAIIVLVITVHVQTVTVKLFPVKANLNALTGFKH